MPAHLSLNLDDRRLPAVARALASPARLRIIGLLASRPHGVAEIAAALKLPLSSTSVNVAALAKAGIIETAGDSSSGKYNKVCRLVAREIWITLPETVDSGAPKELRVEVPVGAYVDCRVEPTCGVVAPDRVIGVLDVPGSFWEPDHHEAGLVYLTNGFVEYRLANRLTTRHHLLALSVSVEMASEYPFYRADWPSDITLWVNGAEMGTWTVPGNWGGTRGKLTPAWWGNNASQYGLLKTWRVTAEGTWIDGERLSELGLAAAAIVPGRPLTFRLGTKPDAVHNGGLTLFGKSFGNYPQDVVVTFTYQTDAQRGLCPQPT
jgi:predicted transcriptional regulator